MHFQRQRLGVLSYAEFILFLMRRRLLANIGPTVFVQTPFGLTADGQKLYVSDWDRKAVLTVDVSSSPATVTEVISNVALPMSVASSAASGIA